jgi:hypothetical protein
MFAGDPSFHLREHHWPCLPMSIASSLAGEARVREAQAGSMADRLQLDGDDCLRAVGTPGTRDPGELNQPIEDQSKEAAVVGMTLRHRLTFGLEFGFEKRTRHLLQEPSAPSRVQQTNDRSL